MQPLPLCYFFLLILFFSCQTDQIDQAVTPDSTPLFTQLPHTRTGVDFTNTIKELPHRTYYNFNTLYDGGGVALGDINNDGWVDIYFTGNEVPNQLYLNKGNLTFENISGSAGIVGGEGWHNGVSMIDINGDDYLDIYVCRGGWVSQADQRRNLLFINQGDLTFKESADSYGLGDRGYSFQSSFFDFDNDGDLDVYVINHPDQSNLDIQDYKKGHTQGIDFCKDHLYRNDGGSFTDVTTSAGLGSTYGFGLSLMTADMDNNGYADIYVCNDYTEHDYLFMNNGDGTFTDRLFYSTQHISLFSMGCDFADINNDGSEDLFVTEMLPDDYKRTKTMMADMSSKRFQTLVDNGFHYQYMHNVLQLNQGGGYFSEISHLSGLSQTDWSWACFLTDFDNDGFRDLFVSNGYRRDVYDKDSAKKRQKYLSDNKGKIDNLEEFFRLTPVTKTTNFIFRNRGDLTFEKKMSSWGFDIPSFSNGASIADLDNDGDVDIVVNNLEEPAFIYENNASQLANKSIRIKLIGPKGNRAGIGAKVRIKYQGKSQYAQHKLTRGYLASVEPIVHFGVGNVDKIDTIEVTWHDHSITRKYAVATGTEVEITFADSKPRARDLRAESPLFMDVTKEVFRTDIVHQENPHNDFRYQILLPHRLSQLGPYVSVGDVNGDQMDDFFIGGASRQAGRLFIQEHDRTFRAMDNSALESDKVFEDMGSILFDVDGDEDLDLYVVSGGTEQLINDPYYTDRLYLNDGNGRFSRSQKISDLRTSGSCVVAADYDRDGDIDLFVGGRTLPELYPIAPNSHLLRNDNGGLIDITDHIAPDLRRVGMVTSAVWSDINGDDYPDLIVVGEWMPIKVFINNKGTFIDATAKYQLENTSGWWNRIVSTDLDGDGDEDYILGNLGLNSKFGADEQKPFHIYSNDFDQNGSWDIILAKYDGNTQVPVRGRECTAQQMPFIVDQFPSYASFADASVEQIIQTNTKNLVHYEAQRFSSSIMRNNGTHFDMEDLPIEAQFSTVNAIVVADFDLDQHQDVLIAGNMFQTEAETTRADASIGLLLKGQNDGTLEAVDRFESGIFLPYDIKDIQPINIGGSTHYLVTSNNGRLRCLTIRPE